MISQNRICEIDFVSSQNQIIENKKKKKKKKICILSVIYKIHTLNLLSLILS